ncbi:MAG: hypothetical protein C4290_05300 [Chloroflexota bacterium]
MSASRSDVTCLICGRFLGIVEHRGAQLRLVRAGTGGAVPRVAGGRLVCSRCGGRAILERNPDTLTAA